MAGRIDGDDGAQVQAADGCEGQVKGWLVRMGLSERACMLGGPTLRARGADGDDGAQPLPSQSPYPIREPQGQAHLGMRIRFEQMSCSMPAMPTEWRTAPLKLKLVATTLSSDISTLEST